MTFSDSLKRGFKHTARAISKPFTGANKDNLKELEKIMSALAQGRRLKDFQPHQLRHGAYDFTWLCLLEEDELWRFRGEWEASLQSAIRTSTARGFAQQLNPATRIILMNSTDRELWDALQQSKNRYKAMAEAHVDGFFKSARLWLSKKGAALGDKVHRSGTVGSYLTAVETIEATYDVASHSGARSDIDRKILAAGGLWRVVKHSASFTMDVMQAVVDPSAIRKAVTSGAKVLNHLGGLIAGITDLVQKKEADFRALSSRLGVDQKIAHMKKKYLGSGVIAEGDSLRLQMEQGPARLERAAELTAEELNDLVEKYRHALWWCENWEADCAEMEADLAESDLVKHLRQVFKAIGSGSEDGLVRPSQIAEHNAFIAPNRDALRAQIDALRQKVARFKGIIGPRLQDMEELQAKIDTRRSIANQQRRTAALGQSFDLKRQIATEIAGFDRSTLRPVADRALATPPTPTPDNSLHSLLSKAMADRRRYVAPPVDDDEDAWDPDL
jgi:hypothetical protein